ncbi:hypothetical protein Tco_1260606, partial [Tanacetum coccineum]
EEAGIQFNSKEFDFMVAVWDIDEIEEVNENCTLKDNLQQASTSGTQTDSTPVYDSDGSTQVQQNNSNVISVALKLEHNGGTIEQHPATVEETQAAKFVPDFKSLAKEADESLAKHKALEFEIERLLRAVVSQYIMSIVQSNSVEDTSNLQTELNLTKEKMENCIIKKETEYVKLINPFKASRVDNFVLNKPVKVSVRTKPIIVAQPHVIIKKDVNSNTSGFSPKDVESTTKTRRPQPRNNPKNARVPSKSKSSFLSNKLEKMEENHRSLQSSNYLDHTSSECNNIKLAIRNEKFKVICATCKQCLITANHDKCMLQYVNGMKSRKNNQSANVSKSANQKKHKANVKKLKKSGSKKSLASPRPNKPRTCLRWLPTSRIFNLCGKITSSNNTDSKSNTSVSDNASASNPLEPPSKRFPNSTSFFAMFTRLQRHNTCIHPLDGL